MPAWGSFAGGGLHKVLRSRRQPHPVRRSAAGTRERESWIALAEDDREETVRIVTRFNDALNAHDVEAMMALMIPDCVFENTFPPPDGTRYEGSAAIRAFWEEFLRASPGARFEIEEIVALGSRCAMRWTYHWADAPGKAGHVRGVDLYRLEDGLIAEKLSYVKG